MQPAMLREPGGASQLATQAATGATTEMPQAKHTEIRSPADYVELKYRNPANVVAGKFASGLALFSFGLGLAEALMPRTMAKAIGVDESQSGAIRALGLREIGHGLSIMMSQKPTAQVWGRVGGDAIDLAYLGYAASEEKSNKTRLAIAAAAVLGATALDVICAQMLTSQDWTLDKINPNAPTTIGQSSARQPIL